MTDRAQEIRKSPKLILARQSATNPLIFIHVSRSGVVRRYAAEVNGTMILDVMKNHEVNSIF